MLGTAGPVGPLGAPAGVGGRGTGAGGDAAAIERVIYEGYGPAGVAVLVEALTDNRNRTSADMRHTFDKTGSGLGEPGSVAWVFEKRGVAPPVRDDACCFDHFPTGLS